MWGMLFGAVGLGFFTYGKKQKAVVPLAVGVALFLIPYIMPNVWMLVIEGVILMAIPYFVRIWEGVIIKGVRLSQKISLWNCCWICGEMCR